MTITEAFNSSNSYGVTYVSLDDTGMQFESESTVHLEDGSLLTLRMPTRQSEKLDIHEVICQHNGWCLAA